MNGYHLDTSPLSEQMRTSKRQHSDLKKKASRVPASRKITRSASVPVQKAAFGSCNTRTPKKSPREQNENSPGFSTPRSTQDRVKQAIERAAKRSRPVKVPDLNSAVFHRSRSAPALPQNSAQVQRLYSRGQEPKTKRAGMLRKKLHEIVSELEQLENGHGSTPSSGLSAGWELAVREAQKKEDYLQSLLNQALDEIKVLRMQRGRAEEELTRLRMDGRTSLDEELKDELVMAGCYPNGVQERSPVLLKSELVSVTRERDALKRQLGAYTDRSPTRYSMSSKSRDGLKRIELEARCTTLEQMVKNQELTRSQLLLPNTVRSVLSNYSIDTSIQESIMSDIHVFLQQQSSESTDHSSHKAPSRPSSPQVASPVPRSARGQFTTPLKSPSA
eukprot:TRINITY_DN283_c3_g1_i1.p1 TRINITY_DN283_c3_g1~~TRINITY_DN283_c3_g1_i1.p1  ORF type:complete len:389 (+),score=65.53 TRINITY_DN283_c3_g1_i1:87-1253(+)